MRGRTFDNTFVIADEMQNSTLIKWRCFSHVWCESKMIVLGDLQQSDLLRRMVSKTLLTV